MATITETGIKFPDGTTQTSTGTPGTYDIEYLIVGGGGSAEGSVYDDCGGGGGGGYRSSMAGNPSARYSAPETPLNVTQGTTYNIVVGAGGTAWSNGSNSSFGSIVSAGGGRAGGHRSYGYTGGSGGGGNGQYNGADNVRGGHGYFGQGYDGGTKTNYPGGGGGGGAGAAGEGGSGTGKKGGAGVWSLAMNGFSNANATNDTNKTYYAGGGGTYGGGEGGTGGGGKGWGTSNYPQSGGVNTGGGAGGNKQNHAYSASVSGGSGIVIIKIPTANYTGTITGSTTTNVVGSFTLIKFTGSGSYTA
jgi:hypothetical protein